MTSHWIAPYKLLIVALALATSSAAFGQLLPGSPIDYSEDPIYRKTVRECSLIGPLVLEWESLKSAWNSFDIAALWNVSAAVNFYHNKGLSPEFRKQLDSDAFYAALNTCYPNDEFSRSSFTLSLITNDIRGTLGGATIAFFLRPAKILKAIKVANPMAGRAITGTLLTLASVRAVQTWKEFFAEGRKRGTEQVKQLTDEPKNEIENTTDAVRNILDERIVYLKARLQSPNLSDARKNQIREEITELEKQKNNTAIVLD